MRNLDEYVEFVRGIKNAESAIKKCEEEKAQLEQMKQLLSKNRDKEQTTSSMSGTTSMVSKLQHQIE